MTEPKRASSKARLFLHAASTGVSSSVIGPWGTRDCEGKYLTSPLARKNAFGLHRPPEEHVVVEVEEVLD